MTRRAENGFTLVEMALAMVVVTLLIGGIFVGRSLIKASEIRSTIAQIDRYQAAVSTFQNKYNAMPGDMRSRDAVGFGFFARAGGIGDGDGNGIVEGLGGPDANNPIFQPLGGETVLFWTDLSASGLIEGKFSDNRDSKVGCSLQFGCPTVSRWLPPVKVGRNSFVIAQNNFTTTETVYNLPNYSGLLFEVTAIPIVESGGQVRTAPSMSPSEGYAIDSKIDDGAPLTGAVISAAPGQIGQGSYPGYNSELHSIHGTTDGYCVSNATAVLSYNVAYGDTLACALMFGSSS